MGIIRTTKFGACPNCGTIVLNLEESANYANDPRSGAPVYCPECDLSGEINREKDADENSLVWVNWFGAGA